MGKTIFAAVVAAVLASIATVLVMNSFQSEKTAQAAAEREKLDATERVERERLVRRVTEMESRVAGVSRADRRAPAENATPSQPAGDAPAALAPDGTPYVSRAELEEFAKSRGPALADRQAAAEPFKPVEKKSLEDIAREQNLSAGEEANLRNILRESEEEMVRSLFGDKPLDEVKREILESEEDPDKKAALMQGVIQNGFANVGKILTLENRTKKKVKELLGEDRAAKFLATPRKSVVAPEFEAVLRGL